MPVRKMLLAGALLALANQAHAAPLPKPASFATCSVCHKVQPGVPSAMGPNLWGVAGRKAGTLPGYAFTPAMKKYGQPWTKANLVAFLTAPAKVVPGNKMAYAGQRDPKAAEALADYLLSLK
ncbi:cytochrome c [Sphingomonas laterariae]|uniref:Cytochrome c n=1 Tax=Edaphosphingomonas laterariae TaxID=861865 RepID=A0A239ES80_9SPHN|nr:c-type cytochrome [Sphingomonas laterariae]SNS47487.1 cytochrome c [Sphingomonas laterariae]